MHRPAPPQKSRMMSIYLRDRTLALPLRDAIWQWMRGDKPAAISYAQSHSDPAWRERLLRVIIEHEAHHHPQQCAVMIAEEFQRDASLASAPTWVWLTALVCDKWSEARIGEATAWVGLLPASRAKDAAERIVRREGDCGDYAIKE
jgi:hypothetical protein